MLTLAQIKNSSVGSIAGVNVQDPQFAQYVNDAVRQLMDLGNGGTRGWWGTVQAIEGVAYDGCFVWPSNVQTVLGITDRRGIVEVHNQWYSFVEPNHIHRDWACRWEGRPAADFDGTTCLFQSIASSPTIIRVIPENASDIGQSITLYGQDAYGVEQVYPLILSSGGTNTPAALQSVHDVAKSATAGRVKLYAYDPIKGLGSLLAIYNGGDINPRFLFSLLRGAGHIRMPITALVRIGFYEVLNDSDILPIDIVDAIKSQVQAIRARESGNSGDSYEKDAMRRLVNQVNTRFPLEQFVVSFKPFGRNQSNVISRI